MRRLLVGLALCGCGSEPAAAPPPAKVEHEIKRVPLGEIPTPNHDAASMAGAEQQFLAVEAEGSMEASLNGVATKFEFMPTGSNVAIHKPDKGIARVSIGGAPTSKGLPLLEISLVDVRLDTLKLPFTLPVGGDDGKPRASVEYSLTEQKVWHSEPGGSVIIESYTGKRVKGTFSGKLVPRATAFGPPIELTGGRFEVELRLNGALPGPT